MPSTKLNHLLPHWDSDSSPTTTATEKPEEHQTQQQSMILISVPPSLESALRAVARDVDGVDPDLRKKISDRLPSLEDEEQAAAAAAASEAATKTNTTAADVKGAAAARVTLTPATLARALPHIRRVMGHGGGDGSGSGDGEGGGAGRQSARLRGSALGLLRGGGLVFPEARAAAAAAMKHGEERRAYAERRDRLLLLREQKEYQRMTANIQRAPRETVHDMQASFKFQAGMGANMVMAIFATFIVSYWASKFIVGDNKSHRLVIGLVGAVFMMLVEMLVFVTRSLKADEVLEAARQDAEESHTAVGVHRLAPRVGEPKAPTIAGRGVLEQPGTNSSSSGRREGRRAGEYELVATREEGEREQDSGVSDAAAGIGRVISE